MSDGFKTIGLAKEAESPENPGGFEKRVALVPAGVAALVAAGVKVFVEKGAGERMGFSDADYERAGAAAQDTGPFYGDKDLIVKLKGPSMKSIPLMRRGCALFCMFHLGAYPERTESLKEHGINVIAMDGVVESPKVLAPEIVLSKVAMRDLLMPYMKAGTLDALDVRFIGYSPRLAGAIRRAGNRFTRSLAVISAETAPGEVDVIGPEAVYFYDSTDFKDPRGILDYLRRKGCVLRDLKEFEETSGPALVKEWVESHPPFKTGLRRIECLEVTGRAGARYGFKLLREATRKKLAGGRVRAVVIGYGNVGMGAIRECWEQGVRQVHILTPATTKPGRIEPYLKNADLIVNGALLPPKLRGKLFLITKRHVASVIEAGSVVIDLVGGSPVTRGSIENVLDNTFMDDPYFIENGIAFSALWGWPMMGMERESNLTYSRQVVEVLLGRERLIDGLAPLAPGVKPALVVGPFE